MGVEVLNRSFLTQNANRAYPLVDWSSRLDRTGVFRLSDDLLVELYFPVGPAVSVDPGRFYIKTLSIFAAGVSIVLGYNDGGGVDLVVAVATAARTSIGEFTPLALNGVGAFAGSIGKLVIGRLDGVDAQGAGQFVFEPAATQLDVDCIRPQLLGVSSISVVDANGSTIPQTGNIRLAAGSNMRIVSPAPGKFRFDAIQGQGLTATCDCDGVPATARPITSIQGLTTLDGKFTIVGDACLEVSTAGNGIQLKDKCSSPCCGCQEAAALQQAIDYIRDQLRTLRDFQTRLTGQVQNLNSNVLSSRLLDSGSNCS
jgi:hypothetical protein